MVNTIKFSEFVDGGELEAGDTVVGLDVGENAKFSKSGPNLLPPGDTASRPLTANNGDMRLNTDLNQYEFYSEASLAWITLT